MYNSGNMLTYLRDIVHRRSIMEANIGQPEAHRVVGQDCGQLEAGSAHTRVELVPQQRHIQALVHPVQTQIEVQGGGAAYCVDLAYTYTYTV
ncbi:hypothetical protein EON65_38915 [archaeon]|nr:MAG: hypothetical protein EON65_38915 [archaeon]